MEENCAIQIRGVFKTFGDQEVHRGLDLDIPCGKTTVIVGHSGAGKSVMIKYILGLIKPDRGQVLLGDQDIVSMSRRQLYDIRSKFGVLFQGAALFDSLNVFENVAMPLREKTKLNESEIREQVMEKLELMKIEHSAHKYPSELSGGMQKRVGLARALQRTPEVVLFDEPTTGLDPETTHNIYKLFKETQQKLKYTAIIVSHDIPKVFNIADRVAVLYEGKIVENCPPDQLENCDHEWIQKMLKLEKEKI